MKHYSPRKIRWEYNLWARRYDDQFTRNGYRAPRFLFDSVLRRFNISASPLHILDVGIGTGMLSEYFRKANPGCHITGIDISSGMLRKCRKKGIADTLVKRDFENNGFPFPNAQFDLVVSSGVFELINQPDRVISEMGRVLRPGGAFAFTVYADAPHHYPCHRHDDALIEGGLADAGLVMHGKERFYAFDYHGNDIFYHLYSGQKQELASAPL